MSPIVVQQPEPLVTEEELQKFYKSRVSVIDCKLQNNPLLMAAKSFLDGPNTSFVGAGGSVNQSFVIQTPE